MRNVRLRTSRRLAESIFRQNRLYTRRVVAMPAVSVGCVNKERERRGETEGKSRGRDRVLLLLLL
jgi:hypothetical protein